MLRVDESDFPFKRKITKEEIGLLEAYSYPGKITLIDSPAKLRKFGKSIPRSDIIGFDTETKPSFKKGNYNSCSLVQLAYEEEVILFRLNFIGFPTILADIFSDNSLIKIGIAIHDDIKHLKKIQEFIPATFLDLNQLCPTIGFESIGAKRLTALVLGKKISKRQQVSNWEAGTLSEAQLRYAATDAWICREIFLKLINKGLVNQGLT